ncbi:MAG: class I SAM-dependent methyltransferase [Candidatus Levyibacteriota bacterium]
MIKNKLFMVYWKLMGGYRPERFWNKWAKTFMDDPWQVATHKQHAWMLKIIKKEKPTSLLEVGCGFGRNLKFLHENNIASDMTGIDISGEMIRRARKYIHNRKVHLKVGNILNIPFKDTSFDLVFTHGVLMHVPNKDVKEALSEMKRVAKESLMMVEQNYGGNGYTFIHNYKKLCTSLGINIVKYEHSKELGLDLIYAKVRKK